MASNNGTPPRAVNHLHIHDGAVSVGERNGHHWLRIPAPMFPGDESEVCVFLTRDQLGELADQIRFLLLAE